jgi:hypothetical protein
VIVPNTDDFSSFVSHFLIERILLRHLKSLHCKL